MKGLGAVLAILGLVAIGLGALRHLAGTTLVLAGMAHSSLVLGGVGLVLLVIGAILVLSGPQQSNW